MSLKLHHFAYLVLALAFVVSVYFAYLAFWPFHAVDVEPQPYILDTRVVKAGELITYDLNYCRYTDVKSIVVHELEGDFNLRIDPDAKLIAIQGSESAGLWLREGCGTVKKAVLIPDYVPPGTYRLKETVGYPINFLQTVNYSFYTEYFEVI